MIIVNLATLGNLQLYSATPAELQRVLAGSLRLQERYSPEHLARSLDTWETALLWSSLETGWEPDRQWTTCALVCMCLRGLRGEAEPDISIIDSDQE
jgi:hypothetical protein